jgi:hypothetical protein
MRALPLLERSGAIIKQVCVVPPGAKCCLHVTIYFIVEEGKIAINCDFRTLDLGNRLVRQWFSHSRRDAAVAHSAAFRLIADKYMCLANLDRPVQQ